MVYFSIQSCFKYDYYDHYKVLSVIIIITTQSAVTFSNARITL